MPSSTHKRDTCYGPTTIPSSVIQVTWSCEHNLPLKCAPVPSARQRHVYSSPIARRSRSSPPQDRSSQPERESAHDLRCSNPVHTSAHRQPSILRVSLISAAVVSAVGLLKFWYLYLDDLARNRSGTFANRVCGNPQVNRDSKQPSRPPSSGVFTSRKGATPLYSMILSVRVVRKQETMGCWSQNHRLSHTVLGRDSSLQRVGNATLKPAEF